MAWMNTRVGMRRFYTVSTSEPLMLSRQKKKNTKNKKQITEKLKERPQRKHSVETPLVLLAN